METAARLPNEQQNSKEDAPEGEKIACANEKCQQILDSNWKACPMCGCFQPHSFVCTSLRSPISFSDPSLLTPSPPPPPSFNPPPLLSSSSLGSTFVSGSLSFGKPIQQNEPNPMTMSTQLNSNLNLNNSNSDLTKKSGSQIKLTRKQICADKPITFTLKSGLKTEYKISDEFNMFSFIVEKTSLSGISTFLNCTSKPFYELYTIEKKKGMGYDVLSGHKIICEVANNSIKLTMKSPLVTDGHRVVIQKGIIRFISGKGEIIAESTSKSNDVVKILPGFDVPQILVIFIAYLKFDSKKHRSSAVWE